MEPQRIVVGGGKGEKRGREEGKERERENAPG
jgi:hypothetical protein